MKIHYNIRNKTIDLFLVTGIQFVKKATTEKHHQARVIVDIVPEGKNQHLSMEG